MVLPAIQKAMLGNGLAVWLVESHKVPQVVLNLVLNAGSDHDPVDRPGIATMTAAMMDAGTATQSALAIAERIDFIGASFSVRSGMDGAFAGLTTLTKHLDEALAVYGDVLSAPAFPPEELERQRSQRLTSLLQQKDRASTTASLAFNRIVYGPSHPYGLDPSGTETSIRALTRGDLEAFYAAYYRPNNATLIVVGDITVGELLPKLDRALGGWQRGEVPPVQLPPVRQASQRTVYLIDKPGAPQSEIRIGYPALARSTPDYFPVTVTNRILGGEFSSRINLNLRERRGYTYGARSAFSFMRQKGPFVASGGFFAAKTDSAIHELLGEIDAMHRSGLTAVELEFAKKGFAGSFTQTFETPGQIAGALQNLVLYGLPDDYYRNFLKNIDAVTLDDAQRAASAYLDPSVMAVVVVGDVTVIRPGIEKLGLGQIVLCDTEGNRLVR